MRLAFALVLVPSLAAAGPITIGAGLGLTQDQKQSDSNGTYGLFGRIGVMRQVAAQLELARIDTPSMEITKRAASASLVIDLARGGIVPVLIGAAGLDWGSLAGMDTRGHHVEGGLGVEVRAAGGFLLSLDARIGDRAIDSQPAFLPEFCSVDGGCVPASLHGGEYRSVRFAVGVQF